MIDGNKKNERARNGLLEALNKKEMIKLKIASHFNVKIALSVIFFLYIIF